ncbi:MULTISPECIES: SigE family RNA polymerase sigma factor [Amycolatopsis]|uniref:RNA polymerase sigma factor n=2 Tax=Amycolatopsis TaxID=1813 RepID=A0A1I3MZK5_9PSEU|nr:SigE family RNA polymerase sigma factor [Amycolatopsis sacchari]SFJ02190.1 RNA polymerase sigma-70 factor, sigma-E family [Amycolatopsis sacchari]
MAQQDDFAEFYTASFEWARRVAYALCGDWSQAEELAQAAFVRVYAQWRRIRHETGKAYLRTVLTRTFLDTRRRGREREHPVAEPPPGEPGPNEIARSDDRAALRQALLAVPPRQRAVLVLRFVYDLTVEDVAETLNCSEGTVKSQTARGLTALRREYARQAETLEDQNVG